MDSVSRRPAPESSHFQQACLRQCQPRSVNPIQIRLGWDGDGDQYHETIPVVFTKDNLDVRPVLGTIFPPVPEWWVASEKNPRDQRNRYRYIILPRGALFTQPPTQPAHLCFVWIVPLLSFPWETKTWKRSIQSVPPLPAQTVAGCPLSKRAYVPVTRVSRSHQSLLYIRSKVRSELTAFAIMFARVFSPLVCTYIWIFCSGLGTYMYAKAVVRKSRERDHPSCLLTSLRESMKAARRMKHFWHHRRLSSAQNQTGPRRIACGWHVVDRRQGSPRFSLLVSLTSNVQCWRLDKIKCTYLFSGFVTKIPGICYIVFLKSSLIPRGDW